MVETEIPSIPDGVHSMKSWVGRVGWGGVEYREDEPERFTGFRKNRNQPHMYPRCEDTDARHRETSSCLWVDVFVFPGNPTACLPVLVGRGRSEGFVFGLKCVRVFA